MSWPVPSRGPTARRTEVAHLVVQPEARAGDHGLRPEVFHERVRQGDGRASGVDRREVGGVIPVGVEDGEGASRALGESRSIIERASGTSIEAGGGGCRGPGEDWRTPSPRLRTSRAGPSPGPTPQDRSASSPSLAAPRCSMTLRGAGVGPPRERPAGRPEGPSYQDRAERGLRLTDRGRAPKVSAALSPSLKESPSAEPEGCQGGASR
jgi:hypothetical protein